jgi:hypothetical protein
MGDSLVGLEIGYCFIAIEIQPQDFPDLKQSVRHAEISYHIVTKSDK